MIEAVPEPCLARVSGTASLFIHPHGADVRCLVYITYRILSQVCVGLKRAAVEREYVVVDIVYGFDSAFAEP